MPHTKPTVANTFFNTAHKGQSVHGSIYLEEMDKSSLTSSVKFELVGNRANLNPLKTGLTMPARHESHTKKEATTNTQNAYRRNLTDSRRRPVLYHREISTNTSNMNVVENLALDLNMQNSPRE